MYNFVRGFFRLFNEKYSTNEFITAAFCDFFLQINFPKNPLGWTFTSRSRVFVSYTWTLTRVFLLENEHNKMGSYVSGLGSGMTFPWPHRKYRHLDPAGAREVVSLSWCSPEKEHCCKRISRLIEFARIKMLLVNMSWAGSTYENLSLFTTNTR